MLCAPTSIDYAQLLNDNKPLALETLLRRSQSTEIQDVSVLEFPTLP